MATNEALEILEEVADAQEQTMDMIENMVVLTPKLKKRMIVFGLVGGAGLLLAGGATGWFVAKTKYESVLEDELEEAKAFYQRFYKTEDFATPEKTVARLTESGEKAIAALTDYSGKGVQVVEEVTEEVTVETTPTTQNIFTQAAVEGDQWDQAAEEELRTEDEPYIISQPEYAAGEREYRQSTLTYYEEDDVLLDESDKPIELVDDVVGEGNLTRFGHGSRDNRVVYIRNDKLSMDFEVIRNEGSYAKEVLGFQHDDGGPRNRKFRRGVDE